MTGVRLDHDPNAFASLKLKSIARGQCHVHFELRASAIYSGCDDHIFLHEPPDRSWQKIARTQPVRLFRCQQQISGSNAYTQKQSDFGSNQRSFQFHCAASQMASHGAASFVQRQHGGVENIFES